MSDQTYRDREKTFRDLAISVIATLIGTAIVRAQEALGIAFPSTDPVTDQLWAAIQIWTDIASVESPRMYALNAVVLVTVISAILNSYNRSSASPTILGILTAPGLAIWSKWVTKIADLPFIGTFLYGIGGAARLYLWIGSMFLFIFYSVIFVMNSEASLFVVTTTAILASLTFGTVFGRFEKGLVLSVKSVSETVRGEDLQRKSTRDLCWASMVPVSSLLAFIVTKVGVSSLEEPSLGEWFSTSSSIFLTTFLAVIALYYLFALSISLISYFYRLICSYQNGGLALRESIQERYKRYIKEEFDKGSTNDTKHGYPEEVAEALRGDYKEQSTQDDAKRRSDST